MIVFIDTEVNPQTKKVADYGAVREDGAVLHSHSKTDFDAFMLRCDTVYGHKDIVLRLRSGDSLQYKDGYLLSGQETNVAALSASGKDKLKAWTDKGYEVTSAKVSYTLAWKPKDADMEYAVCLANIFLTKQERTSE